MSDTHINNKLRGGYYTPKPIADFLAKWAISPLPASSRDARSPAGFLQSAAQQALRATQPTILEPSCGDGIILESCVETLLKSGVPPGLVSELVYGIEFYGSEAGKAIARLQRLNLPGDFNNIRTGDFFKISRSLFDKGQQFDAVIGNPPFIRYQNFPEDQRQIAFELMRRVGLNPNRLTNTWVAFLAISSFLLNENGKLAMVIPAELFQVNYAAEIRKFLSDYYKRIVMVAFNKLVFEGIQQEIVLLLCERNHSHDEGINVIEIDDLSELSRLNLKGFEEIELKPIDHSSEKWTQYFLDTQEITLLRELRKHPRVQMSGEAIDVDVGIVTGQNKFFILNEPELNARNLAPYTREIVTRSPHLRGAVFSRSDWEENRERRFPAFIFTPADAPLQDLPVPVQEYISEGEREGIAEGYKCRIRNRWYVVPSVWTPDAFMLRQVNRFPKLVLNLTSATCTDTIHRVKFINGYEGKVVTAAFLNSLTFAFSEITGRSYGGGVLTFEPSEAEKLPICFVGAEKLDFDAIDQLLRQNKIESILDIADQLLLVEGLGLTKKEAKTLRGIWEKLRDRRMNRKNTGKESLLSRPYGSQTLHLPFPMA